MNNDVAKRVRHYEGLVLDLESEAVALTMKARRVHALPEACLNAAARRAGEAGLYGRKADELRGCP